MTDRQTDRQKPKGLEKAADLAPLSKALARFHGNTGAAGRLRLERCGRGALPCGQPLIRGAIEGYKLHRMLAESRRGESEGEVSGGRGWIS